MRMEKLLPKWISRRLDADQRYGLRLTLFVIAVSLVAIPFAWLTVQVTTEGPLVEFDREAAQAIVEFGVENPPLTRIFNLISFLGFPPWFWILIGGTSIYLWRRGRYRLVAYLLTSTIGGSVVNTVVKEVVNRPRPDFRVDLAITFQTGKSFPSGHTMSSTIAYGALLLIFLPLIPKKRRPLAIAGVVALVLTIGISRLAIGVHYISDVVGGLVLGLAWLTASTAAFSIWRRERGKAPVHATEGVEPESREKLKPSG